MIKRSGAILLTLLYIVTVFGFALNLHYCGTQIASASINAPALDCGMSKVAGKMKCCKDIHLQVKVKDAHQGESSSFLSKIFIFDLPRLNFGNLFFHSQQSIFEKFFDWAPPDNPTENIATFLKNCIFRI